MTYTVTLGAGYASTISTDDKAQAERMCQKLIDNGRASTVTMRLFNQTVTIYPTEAQ